MISKTTRQFWKLFKKLPISIQFRAVLSYKKWRNNPYQKELQFKRIVQKMPVYSVRIGYRWRAIGLMENNVIKWFWIGSHEDYNQLIKQL